MKGKAFWLFEVFAADQTLLSKVMPSGGSTHPRPGKRNKELMHFSKFLSFRLRTGVLLNLELKRFVSWHNFTGTVLET